LINNQTFKSLRQNVLVDRTVESLKSRYFDYLQFLTAKDFNLIFKHIEDAEVNGFLEFESVPNTQRKKLVQIVTKK